MGITADGRRDHTKDHNRKDSTAVAFLNNMKHNVPINVILGESLSQILCGLLPISLQAIRTKQLPLQYLIGIAYWTISR